MKCEFCGGLIIHDEGYGLNEPRDHCFSCGREPKSEVIMANNLDPQKEEEVKALLKTHSVREIVKETGVAKNTIYRIRNENFTDQERAELKKSANIKGRNKREVEKGEGIKNLVITNKKPKPEKPINWPLVKGFLEKEINKEIIDSTNQAVSNQGIKKIDVIDVMLQEKNPKWTFDDIAKKQFALLEERQTEVENEIKKLMAEHTRNLWRICGLSEYFSITDKVDTEPEEEMENEYIEAMIDRWNEKTSKETG
jgi:hypothetical protein